MFATPQAEHQWLAPLVGEWESDGECVMGPDQPPMKNKGKLSVRSLGGLWIVAVGTGEGPDGSSHESIITIGYDPQAGQYVGSFIASMMTHFWQYAGNIDPTSKKLVLDTIGPKFDGSGGMTKYQDIIEIVSNDHWILSSQLIGDNGQWTQFMTSHNRRVK